MERVTHKSPVSIVAACTGVHLDRLMATREYFGEYWYLWYLWATKRRTTRSSAVEAERFAKKKAAGERGQGD
jgi:hypothetical protein